MRIVNEIGLSEKLQAFYDELKVVSSKTNRMDNEEWQRAVKKHNITEDEKLFLYSKLLILKYEHFLYINHYYFTKLNRHVKSRYAYRNPDLSIGYNKLFHAIASPQEDYLKNYILAL